MQVDMSAAAVAARIHELSRLSRLDDPFRPRVDMSAEAVGARLHELAELSRLCGSLRQAGEEAAFDGRKP